MTSRLPLILALAALLPACSGSLDQTLYDMGLRDTAPEPPAPEPLPAAVVAALPPGAPESTVFLNGDGCYLFSIEITDPPSGYPVRDVNGVPICEGSLPAAPVAVADTSTPPEPLELAE